MTPADANCENCPYATERHQGDSEYWLDCRLNPIPVAVQRAHWCGQHPVRRADVQLTEERYRERWRYQWTIEA